MRVALTYSGCHRRGGVERVLLECANHLQKSGNQCAVFAQKIPAQEDVVSGVKLLASRAPRLPLGFDLRLMRADASRFVQQGGFDVVAGFGVQSPENSVVWVQSVHAAWWEQSRRRRTGWGRARQVLNPFHRNVLSLEKELFTQKRYRRLIALTPEVKADLMHLYGVPAEDIVILPNGFSPQEFHSRLRLQYRDRMRRILNIRDQDWVALFVANEWERKGLMPLLEAWKADAQKGAHLVLAGRLPREKLERRIAALGLRGAVHWVGPTSDVNRWFAMADAFVLPTVYEAWGMVVIEALASGVPVVVSRSAGASVAVNPGSNGILLSNPEDVSEIQAGLNSLQSGGFGSAEQISQSVSEYAWPLLLSKYEKLLRQECGKGPSAP